MKTKFNLDREQLDSSYINSRQDFDKVVKGYRAMKPPIWKNPWFYGPAGLASLAIILTLTFQNNFFANGNNSTLKSSLQTSNNQTPDDTPCIVPLNDKVDIPFEEFSINPKKGGRIVTSNGSAIDIPKNSLISSEKGNVTIKVREFNDQASAFAAGIPMDYGKKSAFESGGMLEIRGELNGKSISIDPDKPITIDMALHKSGENFKFWALDDKSGEWSKFSCKFSDDSFGGARPLRYVQGIDDEKLTKVAEKIETCNDKIVQLKTDDQSQELIPDEYARKLIIDFDPKQFPELASYRDLEFEYVHPFGQTSAEVYAFEKRVKHATQTTWNSMNVSKKGEDYVVTFKNSRESYSLPVRPVLKGASLAQFQQKLKKANLEKKAKIDELEKKKKVLRAEQAALKKKFDEEVASIRKELISYSPDNENKKVVRSASSLSKLAVSNVTFTTSRFGIFNCDRPFPYPDAFSQEVICRNEAGNTIRTSGAYVFDLKRNTRFSYGDNIRGKKIDELSWGKNKSTLIVIDEEGNMYYKRELNKVSLKENYSVAMKRVDRKDVNLEAIKEIINETTVDS